MNTLRTSWQRTWAMSLGVLLWCAANLGASAAETGRTNTGPAVTSAPAGATAAAPSDGQSRPTAPAVSPPANLSYEAEAVEKMVKARVPKESIRAYIEQSRSVRPLLAEEILYLHGAGIDQELIVALIRRGGELQASAAKPSPPAPPPASPPAPHTPPAPQVVVVPPVVQPQPVVTYSPPPVSYVYAAPPPVWVSYPGYTWGRPFFYPGWSYWHYYRPRHWGWPGHDYYSFGYRRAGLRFGVGVCY